MAEPADRRDPALQQLARDALAATMEERWPDARAALRGLDDRYGGDGLVQAALLWIDALIDQHGGHHGSPVALAFEAVETGEVGGADDVRPEVAWAGRLMTARANDDEATFVSLIKTCPDWSACIAELLHMVAINYRRPTFLQHRSST